MGWWVRCVCGAEKIIRASLLSNSRSDGVSRGCVKCANKTHGMGNTREYHIWNAMLRRCTNKRQIGYENYGGRGITVCPEWDPTQGGGFENFLRDVGPRPSPAHSIDRIDVNGHYEPSNVQWALRGHQHRNKRSNFYIDIHAARALLSAIQQTPTHRLVFTDAVHVLRDATQLGRVKNEPFHCAIS